MIAARPTLRTAYTLKCTSLPSIQLLQRLTMSAWLKSTHHIAKNAMLISLKNKSNSKVGSWGLKYCFLHGCLRQVFSTFVIFRVKFSLLYSVIFYSQWSVFLIRKPVRLKQLTVSTGVKVFLSFRKTIFLFFAVLFFRLVAEKTLFTFGPCQKYFLLLLKRKFFLAHPCFRLCLDVFKSPHYSLLLSRG